MLPAALAERAPPVPCTRFLNGGVIRGLAPAAAHLDMVSDSPGLHPVTETPDAGQFQRIGRALADARPDITGSPGWIRCSGTALWLRHRRPGMVQRAEEHRAATGPQPDARSRWLIRNSWTAPPSGRRLTLTITDLTARRCAADGRLDPRLRAKIPDGHELSGPRPVPSAPARRRERADPAEPPAPFSPELISPDPYIAVRDG